MLESVVARLLNQLLGKYVVDLDTENLNVGIFSGQVQLTDLQLKAEALYELNLPIKVKIGTIGKVWLKIPWNYLWNEAIVVNIEDLHIIAEPIVSYGSYNAEEDKRLIRAFKRKILNSLENVIEVIGGPTSFAEHLLTNIINNLQLVITSIHIRYEDGTSAETPLACGLCIGSITAETTNSKWKACKIKKNENICFYLVKIEALSIYWNASNNPEKWDIPSQYYVWRNAMSASLQNFSMNNQEFEFLAKPMTIKMKMTINRVNNGNISSITSDVVIQDCNIQISREQYRSMLAVHDSISRMSISRNFLAIRPTQKKLANKRKWWKYAYQAVLEQRIRPYTWSRIKKVRQQYRQYTEAYQKFLLNPNDTELKMDLQKYEDCLSVTNIVIARKQANLTVQTSSFGEKNFWTMLSSSERRVLCEKIGYIQKIDIDSKQPIEHKHNFRIGNISLALINSGREILVLTMTQLISTFFPSFKDNTFKASLKIEGIIIEGASLTEHLIPIMSSEHAITSPAYFLKVEIEKINCNSKVSFRINGALSAIEILYQQYAFDQLAEYLRNSTFTIQGLFNYLQRLPTALFQFVSDKLSKRWCLNFDVKLPYIVLSEPGDKEEGGNLLILDFGRLTIKTELCEKNDLGDSATRMELEEIYYSRLHLNCNEMQILFCSANELWKDARKEKNTDMHLLPKTTVSATFAKCQKYVKTIPQCKFNTTIPNLKIKISERKIVLLMRFLEKLIISTLTCTSTVTLAPMYKNIAKDKIIENADINYLKKVQSSITIQKTLISSRKRKSDRNGILCKEKRTLDEHQRKENMNEAWARVVDLPGLEDNISPNNNICTLLRLVVNEFCLIFSRSSDTTDREYLMLRLGNFTVDAALMNFGPAYQISLNSILITDKLYTTSSGQYLDLMHSPFPSNVDVLTILFRKVDAGCPDFWTHFHGVETSLVADIGTLNVLLHQEAFHTIIKYTKYMYYKIQTQISESLVEVLKSLHQKIKRSVSSTTPETPVPPGAVKFSHSAHLSNLNIRVCDSDYDIINIQFLGLEMDFLFRANERFVFRSFLSSVTVEHLSDITLYNKVVLSDEGKVYEIKYVQHAPHLAQKSDISPSHSDIATDGSLKFQLGRIHVTFLYKLIVQLQRFIVNLEAIAYIEKVIRMLKKAVTQATDTLKASTKIHLAINIHGPVLLFPQKSDSPNVVVIDTGELTVENFFKEYPNEIVENILINLTGITVSRGIMTLTSNLELQETIIEPLSLHLDVKRFIPYATSVQKFLSLDIDGVMDIIQITLGQRDLSIILAIYVDNIGEGKLVDLIPETIRSPNGKPEIDETVKNLEAFFCEAKQKDVSIKFVIDGIKLMLFFDSGELLSSPIRDLNHGLCKFEVSDIITSSVVYNDHSLDGKLSIDSIVIEEIGPDINVNDKGILHSPVDDNKNNNCNITVNKPPIIDITFHQNKTKDKSIDIIVGRLSLCLSVPFCEKLALFILECLPKEHIDLGIINHGYISDSSGELESKPITSSLSIALRVNKPEFIFVVETTSNKKRYFITKSEILSDYSRHSNRLNLSLSLSGFHTLFYDLGSNSTTPYVVLKRCDVELSKTFTDEKGNKITMTVSSLCIQLCSRVVHSINDTLNDIIEHFKIPEVCEIQEIDKKHGKITDIEDRWEPKKLTDYVPQCKDFEDRYYAKQRLHEVFLLPKTEIIIILELEESPVIVAKGTVETSVSDWSSLLNSTTEMTIQANYYNENLQTWEPVIDPVVVNENEYLPWEIIIKVFQDKALSLLNTADNKIKKEPSKSRKFSSSPSSTDDEELKEDMVYMQPPKSLRNINSRGIKTSLSTFLEESDSENEDGTMEKLASAISDLFTGDWNESEESDYEQSTDAEAESEDNLELKCQSQRLSVCEQSKSFTKSTYFLIDVKETLHLTVTPYLLKLVNEILTVYSSKTLSIVTNIKSINLINDIGPKTTVELYESKGSECSQGDILVHSKTYENEESCPNSPSKAVYLPEFNDVVKLDVDLSYDYEITETLNFPITATSGLYEKIHKHYLRVHIPGFAPHQTHCSKRSWQKLIRLQSNSNNRIYHLLAKHVINKHGRSIVISSPLQIRNETCFALSILYQPSVLQQLNLEPIGDVTNPFETTMRIAVLEPHEHYNVPLYIAYHCKLFIQPAYAEGHYISNEGLWWKDLATELDIPHHITCKPKNNSNLEIFALKILLKRNKELKNSRSHSIPNYIIHLLPPLTLQNYLPYALEIQNIDLKQQIKVEPGEKSSVYSLNLSKDQNFLIKVSYSGLVWTGTLHLTKDLDDKIITLSTDSKPDRASKQLPINIKAEKENNYNLVFYASYWMVNKTELLLQFKASSATSIFESCSEDVLLFSFKKHTKQSITLKVYESSWSNDFSLDCPGTTGLVVCKDHERRKKYALILAIRLSKMCPQYTKIITFLPSFAVINNTKKQLRFMEHNEKTDLWIDLPPSQYKIFWPETSSMEMYVKYSDSKLSSQPFFIATSHRTVLRMDKGSAITVDVTGGITDSFKITFNDYKEGDAPILVKNMCADLFLKIQQQGQSQVTLLNPYTSLLYTWDDLRRPRQLVWNVYNNKGPGFLIDVVNDGYGEEKISFHSVSSGNSNKQNYESSSSEDSDTANSIKTTLNKKVRRDKIVIYWTCHNEGLQKVLLFTQDQQMANALMKAIFTKPCNIECLISVSGLGISLFTKNSPHKEFAYLSLSDAPAIWEVNVGHKWKTLTLELASWIEDKYRLHYKKCQLKDYIHIDFEKMFMLKPFFAELRRSYNPAIYLLYRKSRDHQYIDLKIQSAQIDRYANTDGSVILCPLPRANIKVAAPLIEFSSFNYFQKKCNVYKHVNINVEEFNLLVESEFILHLVALLTESLKLNEDCTSRYRTEMALIHNPLVNTSKERTPCNSKIVNLRLSPISTQLILSSKNQAQSREFSFFVINVLNYLFPFNSCPYMPAEGVLHRVIPLELNETSGKLAQALYDVWQSLKMQFLQQYYSQVLGLQVLVNTFSVQPIFTESATQDYNKMTSSLLSGYKCLLGHLNMSPMALEQCVSDVFTNQSVESIQRFRKHSSYHKTSIVPKSIMTSCKNFTTGVTSALDQLIAKNTRSGIQYNGETFFRGTGKALYSLLTRHPDDKSDNVQIAIEALRRASMLGEPVQIHQRLARYYNHYLGIRPFSAYESMGHYLLENIANGRFAEDTYWAHATIDKTGKSIIIITLEHLIRINKYRLWGTWDMEWCLDLDDIASVPHIDTVELVLNVRQEENKFIDAAGKLSLLGDKEMLTWLQHKIEQAIVVSMEEKAWPVNE